MLTTVCLVQCVTTAAIIFSEANVVGTFRHNPALVSLTNPNGRSIYDATYYEVGQNIEFNCEFSEHYVKQNLTYDLDLINVYVRKREYKQHFKKERNDTAVKFIYEKVPFHFTGNACQSALKTNSNKSGSVAVGCCVNGTCEYHQLNGLKQVISVQVIRRLLQVQNLYCFVQTFEYIYCTWSPTIEGQKDHTGVYGTHQNITVKQDLKWKLEGENDWNVLPVKSGSSKAIKDFNYVKNQAYLIEVNVSDLLEYNESSLYRLNTTESIKINPVTELGLFENPKSTEVLLKWKLPFLVEDQQDNVMECKLVWKCWYTKERIVEYSDPYNHSEKQFKLTKLTPYSNYTVIVSVRLKYSNIWSDEETNRFTTTSAAPDTNPKYDENSYSIVYDGEKENVCTAVEECLNSPDCRIVNIYWQRLHRKYEYGDGFEYEIQYQVTSNWRSVDRVRRDTNNKAICVPANEIVHLRVLSKNYKGKGPSDNIFIRIPPKGKELAIKSLMVESENGTNFNISWSSDKMSEAKYYLYWCRCEKRLKLQECDSDVSLKALESLVLKNGRYSCTIDVNNLTNSGNTGTNLHRKKRNSFTKDKNLSLWFKKSLIGIAVANQGQTSGIVWSKVMYLNDASTPITPTYLEVNSPEPNTLVATWQYKCRTVCPKPVQYIIFICSAVSCSNHKDWKPIPISGDKLEYRACDLVAHTYYVKIKAYSEKRIPSRASGIERVFINGPALSNVQLGLIIFFGILGLLLVFAGVIGIVSFVKWCKKKQRKTMIEVPGPLNRCIIDSISSRNRILGSKSSSDYGRQTSDEPLINIRYNGNGFFHLPPMQEREDEDDEVFSNSNNGFNKHILDLSLTYNHLGLNDTIPFVPLSVFSSNHMNGRLPAHHNSFNPREFINIPNDYLTTVTPSVKKENIQDPKLKTESPESGSDDVLSYCIATVLNGKKPVESDDRLMKSDSTELMQVKDDSNEKILDSSNSSRVSSNQLNTWSSNDVDQSIEDLKFGLMLPDDLSLFKSSDTFDQLVMSQKSPMEDYWKSSTSGSDMSTDKEKGISKHFLDIPKAKRDIQMGISNETALTNSAKVDLEKNQTDKCLPTSLSDGSLQKGEELFSIFKKPNGYVYVSTSTIESNKTHSPIHSETDSLFAKSNGGILVHQASPQHQSSITRDTQVPKQSGYISLEELPSAISGSKEKYLGMSMVTISKSFPLNLNRAKSLYVSLEDVKKITLFLDKKIKPEEQARPVLPVIPTPQEYKADIDQPTKHVFSAASIQDDILGTALLNSAGVYTKALKNNKVPQVDNLRKDETAFYKCESQHGKTVPNVFEENLDIGKNYKQNSTGSGNKGNVPLNQNIKEPNILSQIKDKEIENIPTNLKPVFKSYSGNESLFDCETPPVVINTNLRPVFKDFNEYEDLEVNLDSGYSLKDYNNFADDSGFTNDYYSHTCLVYDSHNEIPKVKMAYLMPSILNEDEESTNDVDQVVFLQKQSSVAQDSDYCNTKLQTEALVKGQVCRTPSLVGDSSDGTTLDDIDIPVVFAPPTINRTNFGENDINYVSTEVSFN